MAQSNISNFFVNKSVLVTGITGFIGRAILIKLLRSCPGITHIYVLIRENRSKNADERLAEILATEPFKLLGNERSNMLGKVIAINGNLDAPDLGLSNEDRQLLCTEVTVVLHSASSVKFDDTMQKACQINVQGVYTLLEQLALKMDKLEAFVYLSTAYAHCDRNQIEEKIYPTCPGPQDVLNLLAPLRPEEAVAMTPKLLRGLPNTYIFTKSLAEQVVESYRKYIPICIIRPSVVLTARSEPTPGWIHGWNGLIARTAFVLHGFQRFIFEGTQDYKVDLIPVDHVVNLTIAAAWNTATASKLGRQPTLVYNCCSGGSNPITARQYFKVVWDAAWETPLPKAVRYPSLTYVKTNIGYRLCDALFHRLPCHLMDFSAKLLCQKPQMMKAYWKMCKISHLLEDFTGVELDFVTENTEKLYKQLNLVDRRLFDFDIGSIQWEPYLYDFVAGIRKYLLHGSDEDLERDRRRHKRLFVIHWTFRGLFAMFIAGIAFLLLFWLWTF